MMENREQRLGLTREEERLLGFDYNSLIRHGKATVGVYLQAHRLGSERFLQLQRALLEDYRYRSLPVGEFASRLEAAGATGAGEFFESWARGDARIEFDVDQVESEKLDDGWVHRVHVRQVGTIPYDLDVELVGADGARLVRTVPTESFAHDPEQILEVELAEPLSDVRLDPSGALPMWNSSGDGMRRAFLQAMYRADLTPPFLALAPDYLQANPDDDHMRLLFADRLFALGRHEQLVATQAQTVLEDPVAACATRYSCWSAILVARSLSALGRVEEAREFLIAIEEPAGSHRLDRFWGEANAEASGSEGQQ
jgi:hypothetical protein